MADIQTVNFNQANKEAANVKTDFNDIEWLLFKNIDSEDIQELAMKARSANNAENDILTQIDINILESHGLKIV